MPVAEAACTVVVPVVADQAVKAAGSETYSQDRALTAVAAASGS